MGKLECWILPGCVTLLAILQPCKPPLLSANFCENGQLELNFANRCIFIIVEFLNMATILISAVSCCMVTLVPCLSFLLAELKGIENLAAGISDYIKLQVLEKIVNSVLRDRLLAVMGYFGPFVQLMLCFIAIKIFHTPDVHIFRGAVFIWAYIGILGVTLVTFSVAGNVIRVSMKWILACKGRSRSALERRMCRSLNR